MESSKKTLTRIVLTLVISQFLTAGVLAAWAFLWLRKSGFEIVW